MPQRRHTRHYSGPRRGKLIIAHKERFPLCFARARRQTLHGAHNDSLVNTSDSMECICLSISTRSAKPTRRTSQTPAHFSRSAPRIFSGPTRRWSPRRRIGGMRGIGGRTRGPYTAQSKQARCARPFVYHTTHPFTRLMTLPDEISLLWHYCTL